VQEILESDLLGRVRRIGWRVGAACVAERVDCRRALWGMVNVPIAECIASVSAIVLPVIVLLNVIVALDARLRSSSLDWLVLTHELRNVHLGLRLAAAVPKDINCCLLQQRGCCVGKSGVSRHRPGLCRKRLRGEKGDDGKPEQRPVLSRSLVYVGSDGIRNYMRATSGAVFSASSWAPQRRVGSSWTA
jgi:hypothetical protein